VLFYLHVKLTFIFKNSGESASPSVVQILSDVLDQSKRGGDYVHGCGVLGEPAFSVGETNIDDDVSIVEWVELQIS
jgi:hypothetical protein